MIALMTSFDFQSILNYFDTNTLLGWISIILGVFTLIRDHKRDKIKGIKPKFFTKSTRIIKEDSISFNKDIKVLYKKRKVKSLTITKLAFWNGGTTGFYHDYTAELDPLRIEIDEDFKFLNKDLLYSDTINGVSLNYQQAEKEGIKIENKKIIDVSFKQFSPNNGFVVKLYHTASSGLSINVKGSFLSGEKIERIQESSLYPDDIIDRLLPYFRMKNIDYYSLRNRLGNACYIVCCILIITLIGLLIFGNFEHNSSYIFEAFLILNMFILLILGRVFKRQKLPRMLMNYMYED